MHDLFQIWRKVDERRNLLGISSAEPQDGNLSEVDFIDLNYSIDEVLQQRISKFATL